MSLWDKLDPPLASIYVDYVEARDKGNVRANAHAAVKQGTELPVTIYYQGDLAPLKDLGFRATVEEPQRASGMIRLADLERLCAHSNLLHVVVGRKPEVWLDQSVPDIHVRNAVWTLNGSNFSGTTGKGVIVGIIDTGIDFQHPYFMSAPKTSRILRIWDTGLQPEGAEKPPKAGLFQGTPYGVEYKQADITAALNGGAAVRHRDCEGHGTHVASIAAGNGGDSHKYAGVAPEAGLIIVKMIDLANDPPVSGDQLKRDCVNYILNTAKDPEISKDYNGVVINCSFGNSLGPHDGYTNDADFLTFTFDPVRAKGQILVNSGGNSGNRGLYAQHARIEFTNANKVATIPFEVFDDRTSIQAYNKCAYEDETDDLEIDVYYPNSGPTLKVGLDLPDPDDASKQAKQQGFFPGADFGGAGTSGTYSSRKFVTGHRLHQTTLTDTQRGTVARKQFFLTLSPDGKKLLRRSTDYRLRITASGAIRAHVWTSIRRRYGVRLNQSIDDGSLIFVKENRFQVSAAAAASNILTVASYDSNASDKALAPSSSRGPVVNYGTGAPPPPPKPDIAAPGVEIDAAHSRDDPERKAKKETVQYGGTSMAAPHVTGVVALMLQKNAKMTVTDVLKVFKDFPSNYAGATALTVEEGGLGRIDGNLAVTNTKP